MTGLQPNDCAHALLRGERGHRSRVVEVATEWPFAVDGFAGGKCGRHERSMVRNFDRNGDHVDIWLGHHLLVVREHRAHPEHLTRTARGLGAVRAERADLVVRQRA